MASGQSNYLSNALLNNILRGVTFTAPSTLYVCLTTVAPTDASTGTSISSSEPSGNNYSRVSITPSTSLFSAASSGSCSNSSNIVFPTSSGTGWGTIGWVAITDASTNGNLLYWGALTTSLTVSGSTTVTVNTSNLTISMA